MQGDKSMIDSNIFRRVRIAYGLSQREIAEKIGRMSSLISYYESGKKVPGLKIAQMYRDMAKKKGIKCTIEDFLMKEKDKVEEGWFRMDVDPETRTKVLVKIDNGDIYSAIFLTPDYYLFPMQGNLNDVEPIDKAKIVSWMKMGYAKNPLRR